MARSASRTARSAPPDLDSPDLDSPPPWAAPCRRHTPPRQAASPLPASTSRLLCTQIHSAAFQGRYRTVTHPTVAYSLLCQLAKESLTGYELSRRMRGGVSNYWSAPHSQIYPQLGKLVAAGWVTYE